LTRDPTEKGGMHGIKYLWLFLKSPPGGLKSSEEVRLSWTASFVQEGTVGSKRVEQAG